jgi:hypothetical protein
MRSRFVIVLGLALAYPFVILGADPVAGTPLPEPTATPEPALTPPAPVVIEKPKPPEKPKPAEKPKPVETIKPVEKPKAVEKPKPVEKPQHATETVRPPDVTPSKPIDPPPAAAVPTPVSNGAIKQEATSCSYSFGCLALSFAMLVIGIAAGFLGRHMMSRHKLGGMTVRIGTWRGIP